MAQSKLDPRIEAIRERYGLEQSDFWELPQKKGTWVAKHAALEVAAAKAGIIFDNPIVIEAHTAEGIAVLCVAGQMAERREWATGEASPKNNHNTYPWAMAEKRAKDRVILKLIGIHGLAYSEEEIGDDVQPKSAYRARKDGDWEALVQEIDSRESLEELNLLVVSKQFQDVAKRMPKSWIELLSEYIDKARAILGNGYVAPNFDAPMDLKERLVKSIELGKAEIPFPGDLPPETVAAVRRGNTP